MAAVGGGISTASYWSGAPNYCSPLLDARRGGWSIALAAAIESHCSMRMKASWFDADKGTWHATHVREGSRVKGQVDLPLWT